MGFDQHLNATIPLDAYFRDESGRDVQLGDYFDTAPVVLVFAYYGCSTLCPTVISDLAEKLDRSGLTPGGQYQVIVASIDAGDTPAIASSKKAGYLGSPPSPRTEKAWHLLTGTQASISALTQAAGFRALYDADAHQFAHPAGIVVLTPQGTIARYFFGFDYTPLQLRSALDEAAARHIASPVERLLLLCFHFDPSIGKHSATIMQALRGVTIAALLIALTALIGLPAWRRMRTRRERRSLPVA
ncbi:MAG: SCO family protein [Burkholderiaceae bacterium]